MDKCIVEECINQIFVQKSQLCRTHYRRLQNHGDVNVLKRVHSYDGEICQVELGCTNPIVTKNACEMHHARFRRTGSYNLPEKEKLFCEVDNCNREFYGKGLCKFHYDKNRPPRIFKNKERDAEGSRYRAKLRRVRKKGAVGDHSEEEWQEVLVEFDGKCAYCGEEADTKDHVMPLTRGGTHYIDNIVPACRSCNSSKGNKTLAEWFEFIEPDRNLRV